MSEPEITWSTDWSPPEGGHIYTVTITLGQIEKDGAFRWEAVGVAVTGGPVTSVLLRKVAVFELTRQAIAERLEPYWEALSGNPPATMHVSHPEIDAEGNLVIRREVVETDTAFMERREAYWASMRSSMRLDDLRPERGAPRKVTDDLLRQVADVHRYAVLYGHDPRRFVVALFDTSDSTASRWITRARDAGFLPPSGRKRKGKGER